MLFFSFNYVDNQKEETKSVYRNVSNVITVIEITNFLGFKIDSNCKILY